jgi:hypothetical protein
MRSAGHGQQEALHLRGELAARGFLLREAHHPIHQAAHVTGYHNFSEKLELGGSCLVHVEHGRNQTDDRHHAQPGGNLQLAIAPTDRQQLTGASQEQKEENSKDGHGLLQLREKQPRLGGNMHKAGKSSEGPDYCARDQNQRSDHEQEPARQRGAERPKQGPGQLNQNAEEQGRIDDGLRKIGTEIAGRVVSVNQERSDVAQDVPDAVRAKNGQGPPRAPIEEQPDQGRLDRDVGKPERDVQAQKGRPAQAPLRDVPSLAAIQTVRRPLSVRGSQNELPPLAAGVIGKSTVC